MVKRYTPLIGQDSIRVFPYMDITDNGDYVLYSDREALDEELANANFLLEHARIRCKEEIERVKELEATAKANEEDLKRLRQYERRI